MYDYSMPSRASLHSLLLSSRFMCNPSPIDSIEVGLRIL